MKSKHILYFAFSIILAIPFAGLIAAQATNADYTSNVVLDAQPPIFNVTVPTSLPIQVSSDGDVTVADDIYIINYSAGAVVVSDIAISGKNGWSTVNVSQDLSAAPMDVKEFSMTINSEATIGADSITFDQVNWPVIAASNGSDTDRLRLVYSAEIVPQSHSIDEEIADIVFTISWNAARDDPVSNQAFESDADVVVEYSEATQNTSDNHNGGNAEAPASNSMNTYLSVTAGEIYTIETDSDVYVMEDRSCEK